MRSMQRDYAAESRIVAVAWLTWRLEAILFVMVSIVLTPAAASVIFPWVLKKVDSWHLLPWILSSVLSSWVLQGVAVLAMILLVIVLTLFIAFLFLKVGKMLEGLNDEVRWITILITLGIFGLLIWNMVERATALSFVPILLYFPIGGYSLWQLLLDGKTGRIFSAQYHVLKDQVRLKFSDHTMMDDKSQKAVLLDIRGLKTYFHTDDGIVKAVDGVDLRVHKGETLGVVGESGCGKSVTSMSVMRLLPVPPAQYVSGSIVFKGQDILELRENDMRQVRGNDMAMIFQEPMTSLNPVFRVGDQIKEALILHRGMTDEEAHQRAIELLDEVGIPAPEQRVTEYPHQLSGGMKQRIMIAMALSCQPDLLIADEPTTALDVTIQAQILDLMRKLQEKHGMSIILITHDLAVIAEMADDVAVMYAGKVVEYTNCKNLFANPRHPYTIGLFESIPKMGEQKEKLATIKGMVPNPLDFPSGCRFNTRCPFATAQCKMEPALEQISAGHRVACWRVDEVPSLMKKQGVQ